jgi:hypothetical protein
MHLQSVAAVALGMFRLSNLRVDILTPRVQKPLKPLFPAKVVMKDVRGNLKKPSLKRAALVRPDLLNQFDKDLAEQFIAKLAITRQPVKISITPTPVQINQFTEALSITGLTTTDYTA